MRSHLDNLQKEHFDHDDNCGCEVSDNPKQDRATDFEAFYEAEMLKLNTPIVRDECKKTTECECWLADEQPHGGQNEFGDGCECDDCVDWHIGQKQHN